SPRPPPNWPSASPRARSVPHETRRHDTPRAVQAAPAPDEQLAPPEASQHHLERRHHRPRRSHHGQPDAAGLRDRRTAGASRLRRSSSMIEATHIVIDLETLGKGPRAVIATIGIVVIEQLRITRELYLRIDLHDWQQRELQCDASTAVFWLEQPEAARQEITTREGRLPLDVALE